MSVLEGNVYGMWRKIGSDKMTKSTLRNVHLSAEVTVKSLLRWGVMPWSTIVQFTSTMLKYYDTEICGLLESCMNVNTRIKSSTAFLV